MSRIQKNIIILKYDKNISKKEILDHLEKKDNLKNRDPYEVELFDTKTVRIRFKKKTDCSIKTFYLEGGNNECVIDDGGKRNDIVKEELPVIVSPKPIITTTTVPSPSASASHHSSVVEEQKKTEIVEQFNFNNTTKKKTVKQPEVSPKIKWRKWQQTLFDEIKEGGGNVRSDGRSIIWYYDYQGGTGKTFFCEHFPTMTKKKVVVMNSEIINNMGELFEKKYKREVAPQAFILNIGSIDSRKLFFTSKTEETDKLYRNLEIYSDFFRDSFFVVFSNTFPMLDGLSMNRWIIRRSPRFKDCEREDKDCTIEVDGRKIANRDTMVRRVYNGILVKSNKAEVSEEYLRLMRDEAVLKFYLKKILDKKNV